MVNAMLWAEYTANWLGSLRFNFGLEAVPLHNTVLLVICQ